MDLDTPILIEVTPSIILAIFFIVVASWVRRKSVESKKNWDKAWDSIAPSLSAGAAPLVSASRGVTGCATWVFGWFVVLIFITLFWDFALFEREGSIYVWEHLGEWTEALGNAFLSLLRALARALL
ncbi:MAG: hypothetical protein KF893_02500 [Caldilineaceae bacterium]|nr:hypothetical protein [Caldilineaceae bacterium]